MSTSLPLDPRHLGKYELRERLGRGGMAEVWKAFDTELHRYVAIKLLHADLQTDPEFITRFYREARVIASLHHPHIVQIFDFQTIQPPQAGLPIAYMVMDYVEGPTLAHFIRSTSSIGNYPRSVDIIQLFTSIGGAIDYAHEHGMIHRDIKPANILIDKRNTAQTQMGVPVLTDFGIAKLLGVTSGTASGLWLGTPLYISPEQAKGLPGNERSDIYSLGVILYEICTGVQPFQGDSVAAIMTQHIYGIVTPPALINPKIPPALSMVILRAMAKDPADRFSNASALADAIAKAFNSPALNDEQTHLAPVSGMMPALEQSLPTVTMLDDPTPKKRPDVLATPMLASSTISQPGIYATPNRNTPPAISLPIQQNAKNGTFLSKRRLLLAFLILLLLVGSTVAALYAFAGKHQNPAPTTKISVVGDVTFLNSGQLNAQNSTGVDDQVQVNLHNIPTPAAGKSYYAWLGNAPIGNEETWTPLGALNFNQGNAQLLYTDPQHQDLLLYASSFLVTEEDNSFPPTQPSTDRSARVFDSQPAVITLTHLRHLLATSPELQARQLSGGLGIWFWRNTGKINEWAGAARDVLESNVPDLGQVYRQLVRILDYIDGRDSVSMDVPPGTPLFATPAQNSSIALVGPNIVPGPPGTNYVGKVAPGYVYLIPVHLNAAVETPQATAAQRQLARQIDDALNQVKFDLEQVRQDARQLVTLRGQQLLTPNALSIMNQLVVSAQNAFGSSANPDQPQGNAIWIYQNLQIMATFEVQSYAV